MRQIKLELDYHSTETIAIAEYLKKHSPLSGRSLRKYFFKGLVYRNGKKAHSQVLLKPGDHITVYALNESQPALEPEPLPLDIIYEDHDLIVLNKPPLLAVHPSGSILSGTLANRLAYYFQEKKIKAKIRPVNRLDFGTSGLILFAKSAEVQAKLSKEIQEHRIERIYYAVVQGVPPDEAGVISLPIANLNGNRVIDEGGREAETFYRVIKAWQGYSLLELNLKTGRTHQIRIHLSHIGHPILGDLKYGVKSDFINRPALHAGKLDFQKSEFKIPELTAALPEDMTGLLEALLA